MSTSRVLSLEERPNSRRNRASMARCEFKIAVTASMVFTRRLNRLKSAVPSCACTRARAASTSVMSTSAMSGLFDFDARCLASVSISLLRSSCGKSQHFLVPTRLHFHHAT